MIMNYKIKKGDKFKCLEDYVIDDDRTAYSKGKIYISENNGCITDNGIDVWHNMEDQADFFEYFQKVTSPQFRFKMVFQYRKGETIDWSNPHSIDADTFEEAAAILFKQKDIPPMVVKEIELISQTPILSRDQLFNLAFPDFKG